jgi:hypothetical protein
MHPAKNITQPKFRGSLVLCMMLPGLTLLGCGPEQTEQESFGTSRDETLGTVQQNLVLHRPSTGHTYHFITTPKTWAQADQSCRALGAFSLVIINDFEEEQWLYLREGTSIWWIGYSDGIVEGQWRWYGGASTYTNWGAGEPNDGWSSEDCAVDNFTSAAKWNDVGCDGLYNYICESL